MAEPLTSSDIIRERMGFGVSPLAAPETRRAYMEAGLSPLGTQERERFARGGGISPMASTPEKEAWLAAEVQAGRRPETDLPESYGGIGERPTATTRRGYRMQQEWDRQREMMLQEQEAQRRQEEAFRTEQREGWRFTKEQNEYAAKQKLDTLNERDAAQESTEVNAIASGLEDIDLRNDPEAALKIDQLALDNPLGALREDVAKRLEAARRITGTYGMAATAKEEQEAGKAKAAIINKAYAEGLTEREIEATKFADPNTGIADYNYAEIERLTAQKEGERKTKEPEEKEEYKPISLAQAEDQLAEAEAELNAISEDAEGETLVNAQKKVAAARVRVERAKTRGGAAPAQKTGDTSGGNGYVIGRSYQGMTYLGGDPNNESSWKKK